MRTPISKRNKCFAVPVNRLGKEIGNSFLLRNTVALDAAVALLGGK